VGTHKSALRCGRRSARTGRLWINRRRGHVTRRGRRHRHAAADNDRAREANRPLDDDVAANHAGSSPSAADATADDARAATAAPSHAESSANSTAAGAGFGMRPELHGVRPDRE
jgi:hypothetical protein